MYIEDTVPSFRRWPAAMLRK